MTPSLPGAGRAPPGGAGVELEAAPAVRRVVRVAVERDVIELDDPVVAGGCPGSRRGWQQQRGEDRKQWDGQEPDAPAAPKFHGVLLDASGPPTAIRTPPARAN